MQLKIKVSEKIIENKAVPLKEVNKSENALARLKTNKNIQITIIGNERGIITTDP